MKKKKKVWWQGYTTNDTDELVLARFIRKYGYEPEKINRDKPSCVLVGPLKEEKK